MPQVDLVTELLLLYRAAGRPSYRRISAEIRDRPGMPDTVSHETVKALLSGAFIPRWSKVECVVRQLAAMAVHRPDPEAEVQRFLRLWDAEANGPNGNAPAHPDPAATRHSNASPVIDAEPPGAAEPQIGSVPSRNPAFTGRDDLLGVMRARLEGEPWQPLILHGLSGVGKTSLAVEYVYREWERYDVVWWIVAEQVSQARSALGTLGERRDWPASQDMRQTVRSVLARLEDADFRWLIVFDNAAGPQEIAELVPAATGDVIITTRDADWLDRGRAIPVDVLPREDSIELLRRHGGISFDEADWLAERLGDLPLALEQAAAMRVATKISVAEYLRRLDQQATEVLGQGRPADYPETVANAFAVTYAQVKRESIGAAQLLALLSCLSAEPISLTLLRAADRGDIPPPLGRLLGQEALLQDAVRLLRRFGLVTAMDDGQRVSVHRLVQLIVRDSLTPAEREQAYRNARRLLVAANPGRPDETLTWEMYAQIGPHIGPARLVEDTDRDSRRLVLDHIRYLYVLGDFEASLKLSEAARSAWAGPDDVWEDDQTFACLDRMANALVDLGRYREAADLAEQTFARLSGLPRFGAGHHRTARARNTVAVTHRIVGRYAEALRLEREGVNFYERQGDPDLPELIRARSNLAVSLRAIGDFAQARELDESLVATRTRINGEGHYLTLFAISNLARDLFGLGEYAEALRLQEFGLPGLRARLNSRHPWVILADRAVAMGLRKTGRLAEAVEASREHFHVCSGEFGSDHAYTLAAAMTYANAVRAGVNADASGGNDGRSRAYNLSIDAVNRYRRRFGERNPLTLAAATNQAAILRAMGERSRARRIGEPAYQSLYQQVGAAHPYTQAAAVGLANDLVAAHEEGEATRLLRVTLDTAAANGRTAHPDLLICAVNLRLITREQDWQATLDPELTALRDALGPDHPQVIAASQGQRGECDIEPPPF